MAFNNDYYLFALINKFLLTQTTLIERKDSLYTNDKMDFRWRSNQWHKSNKNLKLNEKTEKHQTFDILSVSKSLCNLGEGHKIIYTRK